MSSRTARGLFVVTLGVLWIILSLALPLSRAVTAGLAALALVTAVAAVLVVGQGSAGEASPGRLGKAWRGFSYRKKVNVIAAAIAIVVFAGAGTALLVQPVPDKSTGRAPVESTTTTTRTRETGSNTEGKSSNVVGTRVIAEKEGVDKPDESLLGRAFDNSAGVILVRLGLALLAAFIAGLVVQRVMLGKYGMTLPFGLGGVPEISDEQAQSVTTEAKKDAKLSKALQDSKSAGPDEDLARLEDPRIKMIVTSGKLESVMRAQAQGLGDVNEEAPIGQLINDFGEKKGLGPSGVSALNGVIEMGAQAAQGAELEPGVEQWLADVGQHLPGAVDAL
jgi:hypothetical protein